MNAAAVELAKEHLDDFGKRVQEIRDSLHAVVVGQDETVDQLLICALTGSHGLLVGVPGLAKTLIVKALAAAFDWKFSRIQFTPDLMPSDITGYELLGRGDDSHQMVFRHGPVFANLVLADEINRAAPKTQSAMLEAMAERHVTVGGVTHQIEQPFLVVATQNPIEQEGTYPLPEAQLDRFMMEIRVGYPTPEQEKEIVMRTTKGDLEMPKASFTPEAFMKLRELVNSVPVPDNVAEYAVKLCGSSRPDDSRSNSVCKRLRQLRRWPTWISKPSNGCQSQSVTRRPHRAGRRRHSSRSRSNSATPNCWEPSSHRRRSHHRCDR